MAFAFNHEHRLKAHKQTKRSLWNIYEHFTLIKLSFRVPKNLVLITEDVIVDVELVCH